MKRSTLRFSTEVLKGEIQRLCGTHGMSLLDSGVLADVLLEAELEGLSGHGLSRFPIYLRQIEAGGLKARSQMQLHRLSPSVLLLDADLSPGPVAGNRAVVELLQVSCENGIGAIAVRNAGHVGALSYYVKKLAIRNHVGVAMANTPRAMAAWGGKRPLLGTNPIAFAVPATPEPVIVDLALSVASRGSILTAARQNTEIPGNWAVDGRGMPTTDPHEALRGALLPAGGAKGYALAVMVEILAGVIAGDILSSELPFPWDEPHRHSVPGLFMFALDGSLFPDAPARLEELVRQIERNGARVPGSRRRLLRQERQTEGIPLTEELCARLRESGMNLHPIEPKHQ